MSRKEINDKHTNTLVKKENWENSKEKIKHPRETGERERERAERENRKDKIKKKMKTHSRIRVHEQRKEEGRNKK
jgi:hypothetical protein